MKKQEIKIPEGCEVDTITTESGSVVVTFKAKEPQLPKSWEEFCYTCPIKPNECFIDHNSVISDYLCNRGRDYEMDCNLLPDRETAEAVLALCQLIQLRECYNQGWKPDWKDLKQDKHVVIFREGALEAESCIRFTYFPLYFKTAKLRDMFLENFRDLIEKLKPLYGIKEGGGE